MSYEPTTWKKGDKVTSTRLNKIEQGIQGNNSEITELKEDLDVIWGESDLLNAVAFGGKTYKEIFEDYNLLPFGDFENGLAWITGNTNGAVISDEASASKSKSLKCFGTSSVQIRKNLKYSSEIEVAVMCKVRVDRYVSGGGAGFVYGGNHLINHITSGFETVYYRSTLTTNTAAVFFGTISAANCDAYIDDACVINLTGLFGNASNFPTNAQMQTLYDNYITLKNKEHNMRKESAIETQLQNPMYIGVVLGADGLDQRFMAMQQLFDIAEKKSKNPSAVIDDALYDKAMSGVVIPMPIYPCAMYRNYDFAPLFAKNADTQAIPASTTKVMSLITGLDYVDNINEVVTIKSFDIQSGSGNVFEAGDTLTIKDIVYAMMLPSSNTAAQAFARVCGTKILALQSAESPTDQQAYDAFISAMAKKASEIGMVNSVFVSASGASANNKTTANDMIRMMVEACSFPDILKIWGTDSHTIAIGGSNPRSETVETTVANATLETYYKIMGGKTGAYSIDASTYGYALVMVGQTK